MNPTNDEIADILNTNGLSEAEAITGKSYKSDPATQTLGVLLHMQNIENRRRTLEARQDTTLNMETDGYSSCLENLGFQKVYQEPYVSHSKFEHLPETLFVLYREPGLLLRMDTHHGYRNVADLYFNWCPNDKYDFQTARIPWSGGFDVVDEALKIELDAANKARSNFTYNSPDWQREDAKISIIRTRGYANEQIVFTGHIDAREAFCFHLNQMETYGKFISPWKAIPFMWLLCSADYRNEDGTDKIDYDYKAISKARAAKLPIHVQEAISFKAWQ